MELAPLEEKLVGLALRRHRRPFYQWGHLLGWLSCPLVVLSFLPALEAYRTSMHLFAMLALYEWYFVVTTRVIGKLKSALDEKSDSPSAT